MTVQVTQTAEHDFVAVARWIDGRAEDGFLEHLLAAARRESW
jgi:hypothetical protein